MSDSSVNATPPRGILLGDLCRHRINGFTGIVVGRAEYLSSPPTLCLMARPEDILHARPVRNGEPLWIEESLCELIEENAFTKGQVI